MCIIDRIRFSSSFGHNRTEEVCTKSTQKTESNIETQDITWKTHNSGKNHDSPRAVEYTIWEEYKVERKHRGNDLLSSSSPHAAAVTRWRQRPLSLSLCISLLHALYNSSTNMWQRSKSMCPKSYLYIYDFWAIYTNVLTNRLDWSGPVLRSAGSLYLPSGGTCFPTELIKH